MGNSNLTFDQSLAIGAKAGQRLPGVQYGKTVGLASLAVAAVGALWLSVWRGAALVPRTGPAAAAAQPLRLIHSGRGERKPLTAGGGSANFPALHRPFHFFVMANTKSAAKRARQTPKRTARNRRVTTTLKTETKRNAASLGGTDKTVSRQNYEKLVSELDKAAKRGVIHKNVANRRKSRLAKKIAALA